MEDVVKTAKECYDNACLLYATKKLDEAEKALLDALKYYETARKGRNQFKKEISAILKLLGDVYHLKGEEEKSRNYYERSHKAWDWSLL